MPSTTQQSDGKPRTLREQLQRQVQAMRTERQSFITQYMELSKNIQPRRGRFQTTDRNKGDRRWQSIINSKATRAHRIARAGLMAGVMSPARPWLSLQAPDPGMMEFAPVRDWLTQVDKLILGLFNDSNFYDMAAVFLGELLLFGTAAMTHVDDAEDIARFYTHTAGSYMIDQDDKQRVRTFAREYEMTVRQLVTKFGYENVSIGVKNQWDAGNYYAWYPVTHMIDKNPNADTRKFTSRFKPYRSVYWEPGDNQTGPQDREQVLSHMGFEKFPVHVARWDVTGEDIYGTDCPAMTALGDTRQLQIQEKRKAQAIDKMVNPPLHGPASLRNVPISTLPGGLNLYDSGGAAKHELAPVYVVDPKLQDLSLDMERVERRIDEAFYVDLFTPIISMQGVQPRNEREITERNGEALLQLGPVLEHLFGGLLDPAVDRAFDQLLAADKIPPPPPELAEQKLEIRYISTLAMAQKAVGTQHIDRVAGFVGGLLELGFEEARDKFDPDQAIDEYARLVGGPPKIVVSDEQVAEKREARAQEEQLAKTLDAAQQGANIAQTGAQANATLTGGE